MSSYISSKANRFYTALETSYGQVASITAGNRLPAVKLTVRNQLEVGTRRDKTGSRTFPGVPPGGRHRTEFELQTYLTTWQQSAGGPAYGPLFQAAMGGIPLSFGGGTVASATSAGAVTFGAAHGLAAGQAVNFSGEIRFVSAIVDDTTVQLNAPFSTTPGTGAAIGATVTYSPATELPSACVYDFWDPSTAVQRLLTGAAVNQMEILVNGDYHEFRFSGVAQDVVDNTSFSSGSGQLTSYPAEPALAAFDYSIVPGNMGQAWLGTSPTQFFTITTASLVLNNNLDPRAREFGSSLARSISPGERQVTAAFELFGLDDDATNGLYQAARQQSPVTVMFQLGEVDGQLMGVHMKSVIPVVPEFNDSGNRLQWTFRASKAQGTINDEITVAFA